MRLDLLTKWFGTLRSWWDGLAADRRRLVAGGSLVALVVAGLSVTRASMPTWVPLADGLDSYQLIDLSARMSKGGFEYQVDGTSLLVRQQDLGAAHAAATDSPTKTAFGDVDQLGMTLTPAALEFALQAATQDRLAAEISRMDGIASANVQIVVPEQALFVDEDRTATASVLVQLRPGMALSGEQVRAIASLVANSVEDLSPEWVAVVDNHGSLLAEGVGGSSGPESFSGQQRLEEQSIANNVRSQLASMLGLDGAFTVTARVELDLTEQVTEQKLVDPEKVVPMSEETEETESSMAGPVGVPGVDAALAERPTASSATGEKTNKTVTKYGVSSSTVTVRKPAGAIKRVSVAVAVNVEKIAVSAAAAKIEPAALLAQVEDMVQGAMGFNEARGDTFSVASVPFAALPAAPEVAAVSLMLADPRLAEAAVAALAIVLMFAFVVRPVMKAATAAAPAATAAADGDQPVGPAVPVDPDRNLAERLRLLVDAAQPLDAEDLSRLVVRESAAAASVVRRWANAA